PALAERSTSACACGCSPGATRPRLGDRQRPTGSGFDALRILQSPSEALDELGGEVLACEIAGGDVLVEHDVATGAVGRVGCHEHAGHRITPFGSGWSPACSSLPTARPLHIGRESRIRAP